jgi:hypothetical protein
MTAIIDYALMAANSYAVKPAVTSVENTIPIPDGWISLGKSQNDISGFTARAFKNNATGNNQRGQARIFPWQAQRYSEARQKYSQNIRA